jgi:hypothetical protein
MFGYQEHVHDQEHSERKLKNDSEATKKRRNKALAEVQLSMEPHPSALLQGVGAL